MIYELEVPHKVKTLLSGAYAENVSLHGFNSKREVFIVQQFAFSIALNWRILFIISLLVIIVLLCGKRLDYGLGLSHC